MHPSTNSSMSVQTTWIYTIKFDPLIQYIYSNIPPCSPMFESSTRTCNMTNQFIKVYRPTCNLLRGQKGCITTGLEDVLKKLKAYTFFRICLKVPFLDRWKDLALVRKGTFGKYVANISGSVLYVGTLCFRNCFVSVQVLRGWSDVGTMLLCWCAMRMTPIWPVSPATVSTAEGSYVQFTCVEPNPKSLIYRWY